MRASFFHTRAFAFLMALYYQGTGDGREGETNRLDCVIVCFRAQHVKDLVYRPCRCAMPALATSCTLSFTLYVVFSLCACAPVCLYPRLVAKEKEPITPFISKVRSLYDTRKVSSILVIGGCGDYFEVADTVIMMDCYAPKVKGPFFICHRLIHRAPSVSFSFLFLEGV